MNRWQFELDEMGYVARGGALCRFASLGKWKTQLLALRDSLRRYVQRVTAQLMLEPDAPVPVACDLCGAASLDVYYSCVAIKCILCPLCFRQLVGSTD